MRYFKIEEVNYRDGSSEGNNVISIYKLRGDGFEYCILDGHQESDRARWFDPDVEGDTAILKFMESRGDVCYEITEAEALELAFFSL